MKTTTIQLKERAIDVTERFLNRRIPEGEILERSWESEFGIIDLVIKEDDCLHFVEVNIRHDSSLELPAEADTDSHRKACELKAAAFLQTHDELDCRVVFDVCSILVLDESSSRAFLRYHSNALGA